MTPGFFYLISAQFVSSLADNALLLVGIALVTEQGQAAWWIPALKALVMLSFVVLAPWVGVWSDRWPKRHVMMSANALKALACVGLMFQWHPFVSFALIGFGASLYSPAKYGLITELEPPERLVKANGWVEVSTVGAAVLGVALGGWLISTPVRSISWIASPESLGMTATALLPAFLLLLCSYALAALLNFKIPLSTVMYLPLHGARYQPLRRFAKANQTLWRDEAGQLSLSVTTLFWGVGATLQLLLLAWGQQHLNLSLGQAAYLQAGAAIGVVAGAYCAGRYLRLQQAHTVLWVGVLMGCLIPCLIFVTSLTVAVLLALVVGFMSGFFLVPMNALLQHRGCQLLRSGESIAVQNFNENSCVLSMMILYGLLLSVQFPINVILAILGVTVALVMLRIIARYRRSQKENYQELIT